MRDDFYKRAYSKNNDYDYYYEENTEYNAPEAPNEDFKIAKGAFSRFGLSLSAFSIVAYAVILVTYLALILIFKDTYNEIISNVYFTWILNFVPMYLIAFPVLYLIVAKMPTVKRRKSTLGLDEFVLLFFVSQGIMIVGNFIGVALNGIISMLLGREITNSVSALIENSPMWIIALVVVIVGPIVEELIFRKLMIDRLGRFGDRVAIVVSSVAFGLFHGNLYQFFYAAGIGLVLGYLYTKTGKIIYPVIMHMIINFMGSVVAIPISEFALEFEELLLALSEGGSVDMYRLVISYIVCASYALLEYGMAIAGIVILIKMLLNHSIYVDNTAEITIPKHKIASTVILNVGAIVFLLISLVQIIINVFWS